MRKHQNVKDLFKQYLITRVGNQKADYIVNSSQKDHSSQKYSTNRQSEMLYQTPHSNFLNDSYHFSENSLDSSLILASQSNRNTITPRALQKNSSHKSGKTGLKSGKTVSINLNKRRLRKLRQIQHNTCSICLQDIMEPAVLSCNHEFCIQCLTQWLKTSSSCPYCRHDSTFYTSRGQKQKIQRRAYQHQFQSPDQDEDEGELNYQCYLCDVTRQGDSLLTCDRCFFHSAHLECDERLRGINLAEEAQWFCHFCS